MDRLIAVGQIVGAHGVLGETRVYPLTDFPERFCETSSVILGEKGARVGITSARPVKNVWLVKFDGVNDRTSAARLKGTYLYVRACETVPLPADSFYTWQLTGLTAVRMDGTKIGKIVDVNTGCGNDLLVIETEFGITALVPFVHEFVREVDLALGIVRIEPIAGLIE